MIRLGLAYTGRVPPAEAVERIAALGIRSTVLWVDLSRGPEPLGPVLERARRLGLTVLGLNAYGNLVHPEVSRRQWNVAAVRAAMLFAAENDVPWVNSMAGTRDPELAFWAYHPDNFGEACWTDLLDGVRSILADTPANVQLSLEPYMVTPLGTTTALRRLIDDVGSSRLRILLDPVNLIDPREYHDSVRVATAMVERLADRLIGVHAKDHYMHRLKATIQIDERVPGEGEFPFDALVRALARVPGDPSLIIEHLSDDAQIASARDFIRRIAESTGVEMT